jgi:hypothetical protein
MRRDQNKRGRLLVVYDNSTNFVSTIADYLDSISRYSGWDVHYVHVTNGAEIAFDLNDFDAIFQSYCATYGEHIADKAMDWHLSHDYIAKRRAFRGVKMLAVQDEYQYTNGIHQLIRESGFHIVLTNAPPALVERIYPREMFPNTEFIRVLTGYVPEHLAERGKNLRRLRDRPIHIGYRGRDIGGLYGRLAFDKLEIGRRMREICIQRGIPHDIEWSEDRRLYGDAWYDFIGSCRVNLGSESGSNVFDFDGTIAAKYAELATARGGPVPYDEFRVHTDPIEHHYEMGQISPRAFEAAALRTPMILFSGSYGGLIKPEVHYIELKKDFSNVDAVLARLGDLEGLERLADRAYDRMVGSGEFSYRRFVELIDACLFRKAAELGLALRPPGDHAGGAAAIPGFAALTALRESPTRAPLHPVFFRYKIVARLQAEIGRLREEIDRLRAEFGHQQREFTRVSASHGVEIAQLRTFHATETNLLRTEIHHLRHVLEEYRSRLYWLRMLYRMYKMGAASVINCFRPVVGRHR